MITKERLNKLIEKGAMIYKCYTEIVGIYDVYLNNKSMKVANNHLWIDDKVGIPLDCLFETKEEAEWHLEFGNIQRTETLRLPSWKEMQKRFKNNTKFGGHLIVEFDDIQLMVFIDNYSRKLIELNGQPRKLLTKENYTEACRLAKKLFLGEKE